MNEPIISPWLIYFLSIVNDLMVIITIGFMVSGIGFVVGYLDPYNDDKFYGAYTNILEAKDKADAKRRQGKRLGIASIVFLLALVFIPSEKTCWKMIIASKVTPAFVQQVGENAEAIANKALNLITDSVVRIMEEGKQ